MLLIFFLLSNHCYAARIDYTTMQKDTLRDTYKLSSDQINNLQNQGVPYGTFTKSADDGLELCPPGRVFLDRSLALGFAILQCEFCHGVFSP